MHCIEGNREHEPGDEILNHLLEVANSEDPIDQVDEWMALEFNDEAGALQVVNVNGCMLLFLNDTLKANPAIVQAAVSNDGLALYDADRRFWLDEAVVTKAVRQNGFALLIADKSFLSNKRVVIEAVRQNGAVIDHVHPDLQEDADVLRAAREESQTCNPEEVEWLPAQVLSK